MSWILGYLLLAFIPSYIFYKFFKTDWFVYIPMLVTSGIIFLLILLGGYEWGTADFIHCEDHGFNCASVAYLLLIFIGPYFIATIAVGSALYNLKLKRGT
ncbi:hypothetical protein HUG20_16545 [Salicibibacter cibi]|uniref:Uncharacterized protein n=1 Tax=Salicibibacter cibi TaxID=2743001 RepID=A0A7T6ZE31_9BACI|nr:hypothetical protein [Salicibibacter cibi]QQK81356.1 hypothetical protein HUG20_16545 [Salicibibacter cibi]